MPTLQQVREQVKAAIDQGDHELASSLVQKIQRSFPEDYETVELLARIYLECNRRQEARDLFRGLLEVDPENLLARSSLAIMDEEDGKLEEALDQFTRLFEIDITNRQVASEIRRLNSRLDSDKRVDLGYSKHALARRLLKEGMYREAVPLFEEALEAAPEPVLVALGMAQALWFSGSLEDAGGVADEILAKHPACLKALAIRAGVAYAAGNPESAMLLEKCARLNPGNVVARSIFEGAEMAIPQDGLEAYLPDEDDALDDSSEYDDPFIDEEESERQEEIHLPEAEVDGEWVRDKVTGEETTNPCQQPREHIDAARDFGARGLFESAVNELRAALRMDGSLLPEVREVVFTLLQQAPEDADVRWFAGDILVLEGHLRLAMEYYLAVLTQKPSE